MAGNADSHAELTTKIFTQHQAAITLLGQLVADPNVDQICWLDLGCGRGQILSQLDKNIPERELREKIGYNGYDLDNEYSRTVEQAAQKLNFASVKVNTGEIQHFPNIFPSSQKFSFVSFTNTVHELNPRLIATLVTDLIIRLDSNGILYIYDMETLPKPELGAVPWSGEDFKLILNAIYEELDCKKPGLIVQKWQHSSCSGWSVTLHRNHLRVSDDAIIKKSEDIATKVADIISNVLMNKLSKITEELDSITKYGSSKEGDAQKINLLHEHYSLIRAITPQVVHLNRRDFGEAMLILREQGGIHQRAFDEATRIISSLNIDVHELNKLSKHVDSRIKDCVKYDITKNHHLVTVHSDRYIYLLFVGTHERTDIWLNNNRGLTIVCNPVTIQVTVTHVTDNEPRNIPVIDYAKVSRADGPYFSRISDFDVAKLISNKSLARELKRVSDNTEDSVIQELVNELKSLEPKIGNLIIDLLFAMREGRVESARARVEQFRDQAIAIQANSKLEKTAIESNVNSDRATLLTGLSEEQLKELFSPEKFQEWMLFLNPEQKRIAQADYEKPAVLTGVSGSGKTCVLVHRAKYLAKKYPNHKIGVLTLNRNLSKMLQNLVEEICSVEERENIRVLSVYEYFRELVEYFGPEEYLRQLSHIAGGHGHHLAIKKTIERVDRSRFAREYDPKSLENVDDAWEIFLGQRHAKDDLNAFADYLYTLQHTIDPDIYLREEFSLIRSAVSTISRESDYLKMPREGRAIQFPEKIRNLTLKLLLLWEETMLHGGVLDDLSLTLALLPNRNKIQSLPDEMRFRCVLIDEFQDLSTLDLVLLRQVPTELENGFFVAGDLVQRVLVKSLKLQSVSLDLISAHRERITKNYRNSRQILKAASHLSNVYGGKAKLLDEEIEILDPELAVRETGKPLALKVDNNQEISEAWNLAKECIESKSALPWSICIATANPQKITTSSILEARPTSFPVKANKITGEYTRTKDTISVGTAVDVKGFEFSMVIIVGCNEGFLPDPASCNDETWREALRLYVAMTRARDSVVMIYSGNPSEFLLTMRDDLQWKTDAGN